MPITPDLEGFRVNARVRQKLARRKRRIQKRLDKNNLRNCSQPMLTARNIHYEIGDRGRGIGYGGIGAIHLLVRQLGLAEAIDRRLHLLKLHLPYHESDHVLNFAYNALCDGTCLQDLEWRRNDEVFLDALGARRIPDPTTAGDFCRRFQAEDVHTLLEICNDIRKQAWASQPNEFFAQARIDADGTLVETTGECKQGMDIAYNGTWGYHPLVVSLANTGEVLSLVNRSGNRPSHEGAAEEIDRAIRVCREGGFGQILVRGDTDFTQTKHLDRWDADGVQFIFGVNVTANLHLLADDLPTTAWKTLSRPPRYQVKTQPRRRPENVKEPIVVERGFENIRLVAETVAEFDYRPTACGQSYRLVVVRKDLSVAKGEQVLFADYRYFLYITNDRSSPAADIVFRANDRCHQENLHAQLKPGGVGALHAPVDNLVSNWAYMVMTALAWNLKAWLALQLPEQPGRWAERHRGEKRTVLTMEFKTFVNAFVRLPCQIIRTSRKLVYRLLSWNPWQPVFFRMLSVLRC
jgi:hypothetical protein